MKRKQEVRRPRKYRGDINVSAKTDGQQEYIELIQNKPIVVCNGPSGCGKTLIAVGMALQVLRTQPDLYHRIILVRPAVTVRGEDIGALPGDIEEKMHPFMLPMLDSLKFFLQSSELLALIDGGTVEIATVAHMRGRSLANTIMILDEAQNTNPVQMKMIVTRMGYNSKLIIEGDVTQSDLPDPKNNGLRDIMQRFSKLDCVGMCDLKPIDVVRSPILSQILSTYED